MRYDYGRLVKIAVAGAVVFLVGVQLPADLSPASVLGSAALVLIGFPLTLAALGFLDKGELRALKRASRLLDRS